jgi:hypothetical protein
MYHGNSDCEFVKWVSNCTEFVDVLRKNLTADFRTNTKPTRVSLTVAERVQHSIRDFLSKTSRPRTIFAFNPFVHSVDERFETRQRFSLSSFPRSQTPSSLQFKALPSHSTPRPSYLSNHEDQRPPFALDACRLRSRRCTFPRALMECLCSLTPRASHLVFACVRPFTQAANGNENFAPESALRGAQRPKLKVTADALPRRGLQMEAKDPPAPKEDKEPPAPKEAKEPPAPKESKEPPAPKEAKEPPAPKESKEPPAPKESKEPPAPKEPKGGRY